jgi:hypothetical protein
MAETMNDIYEQTSYFSREYVQITRITLQQIFYIQKRVTISF